MRSGSMPSFSANSSFVTTRSGRQTPEPMIYAPSAGLVSSRDVSFDCFNGAESFGVDIRVRNLDAAVFLQDVDEINQRETVEGADLKQIVFGSRRRCAVGGRIVVEKSYCRLW